MKYAVHPDYVTSKADGDLHHITADQLIRLYGVDPRECVVIDPRENPRTRAHLLKLAEEDNLTHLWPRFDGNYTLKD